MINYLEGVGKPYKYKRNEKGFCIDIEYLEKLITNKTKVLVFNNHSNPMAVQSSDEELQKISKLCVKHNLLVLSDEAYFHIVYDGKSKSIVSQEGMRDRTVVLFSYSKTFSMTGWRLGAAVGPEWIIDGINKINVNDEGCTTNFIQVILFLLKNII